MSRQAFLGEFEQMVLLAILQLEGRAYGPNISEVLEARAGRQVSRGALYSSLDRLQQKKALRWRIEGTTSERGGHPMRRFEVTAAGVKALRASRQALTSLWSGLDHVLGEGAR